jgi:long-chain acyl-CoA synthetase
VLTGAAPIATEVLEFFDSCGVLVLEGYGLSETTAAATLNTPKHVRFGTVGRPLPGVEISIAADGEILIRDPNVFAGYFRDEPATREALTDDRWLRSGDLGSLDEDGFLRITGRKKDIIITSGGKSITPANIEAALRGIRWVSEALVFGDDRPYLVAVLALDRDWVRSLARLAGRKAGHRGDGHRLTRARPPRARGRADQPALRAGRADQALRDPRSRPHPGDRRADSHPESQASGRLLQV